MANSHRRMVRGIKDDTTRAVVKEAIALGWTVGRAESGHIRLTAPDGRAKMFVTGTATDFRGGRNARAALRRWQRQQGGGHQ